MSRHSPKEIERCKRIAGKMTIEPAGAKAHSLHRMVGASGLESQNKSLTCAHVGVEWGRMNTTPKLTNKIRNIVPPQVEEALLRRRGQYSDMVDIFHCIQLHTDQWVGVAGDGANGSYEHFSLKNGVLECSDCGWGSTDVALLEVLTKEVMR